MIRKLFSILVCTVSTAIGGLSSFAYFKYQDDKIRQNMSNKKPSEEYELTPGEKFLTNLLKSSIKCDSLNLNINGIEENKNLGINFKGVVEYDSASLMAGDFNGLKANGALKVNYGTLNESATFIFDKKLYLGYADNYYSFDTSIFNNVLDLINLFKDQNDNKEETESSLNLNDLLGNVTNYLSDLKETKLEDESGYLFTLSLPDLGDIVFTSNNDFLMTGINGKLSVNNIDVSLLAEGVSQSVNDSYFNGVTDENKYTSTNNLNNIITTLTKYINSKKGSARFNANLNLKDGNKLDLDGNILIDYSNASKLEEGIYELSLNSNVFSTDRNTLKAHYQDKTTYFALNNLIKGYVSNTSIEEIIDTLKNKTNLITELNLMDKVNQLLANSDLLELINNKDYSKIHSIIKNIEIDNFNNEITISLYNKAFNLGDENSILDIVFGFNEKEVSYIKIKNLCYEGNSANFDLYFDKEITYDNNFTSLEGFKDYSNVSNIFSNVINLVNDKKFNVDYAINIVNKDKNDNSYNLTGNIAGDISNLDFTKEFNINDLANGAYTFSINNLAGINQDISAYYLDNNLYLKYNELIKNSVNKDSFIHLFDFINKKFNNGNNAIDINQIFSKYTEEFNNKYKSEIDEILKGNLAKLEDYFVIDRDNLDPNKIKVEIYPNGVNKNDVLYEVVISTNDKAIDSLSIKGINLSNYIVDINLNLKEFNDFRLLEEEKATYYPLDNFEQTLVSFIDKDVMQYGLGIEGAIYSGNKLYFDGNLNADFTNGNYFGELTLDGQLEGIDKGRYKHNFKLDKFTNEDTSLKDFYIIYNDTMKINMHSKTIMDLINEFKAIPEKNVLNYLFKLSSVLSGELPIQTIIKNKEYLSLINNNYIKTFTTSNGLVSITLDGTLLGATKDIKLDINYNEETKTLLSLSLNLINQKDDPTLENNLYASFKVTFKNYDKVAEENRIHLTKTDSDVFFDFDNLKLLFTCGINTTNIPEGQDTVTYYLKGIFDLDIPGLGTLVQSSIYQDLTFKIQVLKTGKVNGYINLTATDSNHNVQEGKNTKTRKTEFFINEDGSAYVHQTTVSRKYIASQVKYRYTQNDEYFKVTAEEMSKNLLYYLMKYTLNISDTIYNPIEEAVNNSGTSSEPNAVLNLHYESVFKKLEYNETEKCFSSTIDLNNICNLKNVTSGFVTQQELNIDIYHDTNNILSRFHLYGGALYVSLCGTITINIDVTNYYNNNGVNNMNEYNKFVEYWNSNETLTNLDYYQYRVNNNKTSFQTIL